ncbi:hypothetical protein M758_9G061800 [Ceratodon purpureus]|nr:hypothetical protein M758_9G061800 [Ceratodon purpureus]
MGDWLGFYPDASLAHPAFLVRTDKDFCPALPDGPRLFSAPAGQECFIVGPRSHWLLPLPEDSSHTADSRGFVVRARVISIPTSTRKGAPLRHQYLAPLAHLTFDPGRWRWRTGATLHNYSAKFGRSLRWPHQELRVPISVKWHGLVPVNFTPDWGAVWKTPRPRKEAAFLWSLYHRAVAVNQWRNRAFPTSSALCQCCTAVVEESVIHCFYDCPSAARAWRLAFSALFQAATIPTGAPTWPAFTWRQCLFGTELPPRFQAVTSTWSLIRGAVIWTIWLCRNACVFNDHRWTDAHLHQVLWDSILDLGRAHWAQVSWMMRSQPTGYTKAMDRFRAIWEPGGAFFTAQGDVVRWNYRPPALRLFTQAPA